MKVQYNVISEDTSPNSRPWDANVSMSAHESPPPASISIAWVSTLDRSWTGVPRPVQPTAADNVSPSPSRSANDPKACNPT